MRMRNRLQLATGLFAFVHLAGSVQADVMALDQASGTLGQQAGGPYTLSKEFVVPAGAGIKVTGLFAFDSGANGLTAPVDVIIFNTATTAAVPGLSAQFTTGNSTLVVSSAYRALNTPITPVVLAPGTYRIAGDNYGGGGTVEENGNTNHGDPAPILDNGGGLITFSVPGNFYGVGATYPNNADNGQYLAGSFSYVAAPEPTSIASLGGATLLLIARRRRARYSTDIQPLVRS